MGQRTPQGVQDQRPCIFHEGVGCKAFAATNPLGLCTDHWSRLEPPAKRYALRIGPERLVAHEFAKWHAVRLNRHRTWRR